ncbi:MAG: hypothetical protein M3063_16770 [Actinomycetota bacterium]|nr:hypothetical protein [Actinomycetota bacterium]
MSRPPDPLGKRSLFSAPSPSAPAAAQGATGESAEPVEGDGRRALFSAPQVTGRPVIVVCRTCRARTPMPFAKVLRGLVPSVWLPLRAWSRWMRCPSCAAFSWCRVEWGRLLSGR